MESCWLEKEFKVTTKPDRNSKNRPVLKKRKKQLILKDSYTSHAQQWGLQHT